MDNKLTTILDRIANCQHTEADIDTLRQMWESGDRQVKLQLAKFNVNIGNGKEIHIGDVFYPELSTEAIESIANQIFQKLQTVNQSFATESNSISTLQVSQNPELASYKKLVNQSIPMNISANKKKPIYIYFSSCQQDEKILEEIEKRLYVLEVDGIVELLHSKKIRLGANESDERNKQLRKANIVLLLVSTDYINSSDHRNIEVKQIMEKYNSGKARVIPILVKKCYWDGEAYKDLKPLPRDRKPIADYSKKDDVFYAIFDAIRDEINDLKNKQTCL